MALNDGRVVSNFIIQALRGEPITMYGSGSQTRSFCFVSDLVDGLIKLMDSNDEITGPVNIGNPNEFTIKELALEIIRKTNSQSEIVFKEIPSDDPKQRKPDITKARTQLKWNPSIELDEGLSLTIQYFKDVLN